MGMSYREGSVESALGISSPDAKSALISTPKLEITGFGK